MLTHSQNDICTKDHHALLIFLKVVLGMVIVMMVIGAITRLTDSGLSMTEWRPLFGFLPPLSHEEWVRIFTLYQQTSEFKLANVFMNLEEFKKIFWWEYIHRLWGRLIGIVYGGGLLFFLVRKKIPRIYITHFIVLFFLGGSQGLIGWWMVKSGFVDRVDVSQIRLMIHLILAFMIIAYIYFLICHIKNPPSYKAVKKFILPSVLITCTIMSGALVAGVGAGYVVNSWPLMDGYFFPEHYYALTNIVDNTINNPVAIQFHHRMLAYITFAVILLWRISMGKTKTALSRIMNVLIFAIGIQILLGIATLLTEVNFSFAIAHQIVAIVCFIIAIRLFWMTKCKK